jgi:hypothetical protein
VSELPESGAATGEPTAQDPTVDVAAAEASAAGGSPNVWPLTLRFTLALFPGVWAGAALVATAVLALSAVDGWLHHAGRVAVHGDTSLPAGLMLFAALLPASLAAFVGWATALIVRAATDRRRWTGLLIFSVAGAFVWLVVFAASFFFSGGPVVWLALLPALFIYLAALATARVAAAAAPPAAPPSV